MLRVRKINILSGLISILLIVVLFSPLISARLYEAPSNANLEILSAEISPQPARPGGDMFVKINIENYGKSPAEDVVIEIEENYPFHFKYSNAEYGYSKHYTNTTIIIPKISAYGCYEVFYYFTLDPLAKSGEYELVFKVLETKGGTVGRIRNIKITVEGKPDLVLTNSSLSPDVISPGDEFIFKTKVASVGTGNSKNIRVSLVLDNLPEIIPLEGSSRFIQKLDAGEFQIVSFKLKVSKDANPTSYNIPVKLTGIDDAENISISQTETIGFDVSGKSKLSIASIKTDPLIGKVNEAMTLTIRIENTGDGDAKSVKASITDLPFSGVKQAFLGEIESDDDSPAVFTVIPDKGGEFSYILSIAYEDDFGKHTVTEELNLVVETNGNGTSGFIIILVVVLAGLGSYYFFKRKRDK
jgi:LPXTG-motif cell wall-anchored protein